MILEKNKSNCGHTDTLCEMHVLLLGYPSKGVQAPSSKKEAFTSYSQICNYQKLCYIIIVF